MPNYAKLPVEFSDLQDLADLFAISDDLGRAGQTGAASIADQRRLVDTISPRWAPSIGIWMATMTIQRIF